MIISFKPLIHAYGKRVFSPIHATKPLQGLSIPTSDWRSFTTARIRRTCCECNDSKARGLNITLR